MTELEKRGGNLGVETRAGTDKRTLTGYAAVFQSDTAIGDYFVERIAPGAFSATLGGDIRALVDHDWGRVIGRTKSGTLRLVEDERGLKVEVDVPNTTDGNDLWELVERGDVSGMSFGFRVTKQSWDETGDTPIRTIEAVDLYEVSAVAFPAYDDTSIGKRDLEAARAEAGKAKADDERRRAANATAAARRVATKRAVMEQKFRGISLRMMDGDEDGDADQKFAKAMIKHHRDAVTMSKRVLDQGDDPEIADLAKKIIEAQTAEIEWLEEWLSRQE